MPEEPRASRLKPFAALCTHHGGILVAPTRGHASPSHAGRAPAARAAFLPLRGGRPLAAPVRARMEGFFGHRFEDVRVREGPEPGRVGAMALAQGRRIVFGPGRYDPGSRAGRALLGHELAHVVQQAHGRVRAPQGKGAPVTVDAALEAEADRLGARAADAPAREGATARPLPGVGGGAAQPKLNEDYRGYAAKTAELASSDATKSLSAAAQEIADIQENETQSLTNATDLVRGRVNAAAAYAEQVANQVGAHQPIDKVPSVIRFGPLTSQGGATWMVASILTRNRPTGSGTEVADHAPIWKAAQASHQNKTLYCQGHLLNHKVGGPARSYNLTPIPGPGSANFGVANANKLHETRVEKAVKKAVDGGKAISYSVKAVYEGHPERDITRSYASDKVDPNAPEKAALSRYQEQYFATRFDCEAWDLAWEGGQFVKKKGILQGGTAATDSIPCKLPDVPVDKPSLKRKASFGLKEPIDPKEPRRVAEFESSRPTLHGDWSLQENVNWWLGREPTAPKTSLAGVNPFRYLGKTRAHPYRKPWA